MNYLVRSARNGGYSLVNEIDRLFGNLFDDMPMTPGRTPAVDVRETEEGYTLEAELPGLTEKDIDVHVEGNLLTISSAVREEKDEKSEGYVVHERRSASFRRSFVLPKDVDATSIEANYRNGLLTLELHKTPESKPRTIQVKVE